ncbi:MAG: oligopeptide/dipeptide ABC transporter ATP-binding protein, partial [Eubacteriales bacterium]|nr:oligopeptide/dipeptide ABC transporter ATP-binding protein [Eubacteriales bacterium]
LDGSIPSPANPPKGCKFHTRCKDCMDICKTCKPPIIQLGDEHYVKCHLYSEESLEENAKLTAEKETNKEETETANAAETTSESKNEE